MRLGSENVGEGELFGPEDLVYEADKGVVYTSCEDGWIKRITVNESVVEDWVNTGGRPLGLAFDGNGQLIVADADKVTGFHINVGFEYVFSANRYQLNYPELPAQLNKNIKIVRPDVITGVRTLIPSLVCEFIKALSFRLLKKKKNIN